MGRRWCVLALAWLGCGTAELPVSETPAPVVPGLADPVTDTGEVPVYTLSFDHAKAHMVDVELVIPSQAASSGELNAGFRERSAAVRVVPCESIA